MRPHRLHPERLCDLSHRLPVKSHLPLTPPLSLSVFFLSLSYLLSFMLSLLFYFILICPSTYLSLSYFDP